MEGEDDLSDTLFWNIAGDENVRIANARRAIIVSEQNATTMAEGEDL